MKSINPKSQSEKDNTSGFFEEADIVSQYTSEEAEEDGILFDVTKLNKDWERGFFRYTTTNLLSQGYMNGDEVNMANLLDLLNQCVAIVKKASYDFQKSDWFYSGFIELPSGAKQEIFIVQNETGKYTIMLPEDY